jgi:hypothetical protein
MALWRNHFTMRHDCTLHELRIVRADNGPWNHYRSGDRMRRFGLL